VKEHVSDEYYKSLIRIKYLANICLVLELEKSLSDIYWLNVNDSNFPYVGIIEHTNMESTATYGGRHIVYLSKYLPINEDLYQMSDEEVMRFSLPYIKRMFPSFDSSWVRQFHVWKEPYTQPITEKNYSRLIPDYRMPIENLWLSTMAQIYPQDRGTNYAVREGRKVAEIITRQIDGT
jgi:protoporphyrinogen oxidase